ncbi:YceD family protein [Kordia zhangzhouensis]|uniref:YceD family protein n=1 Tax=Kordia zhangzhouensis TaxID=1620405 RepID=UPI0006295437|nr:DUF177 domain-containing protein [Kordia zhangzhouensis]
MELKDFTIPFIGLKEGKHQFDYQIDNSFFELFDFDEFNAATIQVELEFLKKQTMLELAFSASGTVNVNCDLTNEPYEQAVKGSLDLIVKFGHEYNDENEEILIIPHGEYQINVAQYIYEMIVLAIPSKRVHPGIADGTLQSEILEKLEELQPGTEKKETEEDIDPRWDTLKKLLTDNK